jgi:hypothetical protein
MKIKFLYHAEAVAASGYITLPVQETMEIQGSVALPITGGHGSVRVENCRHRSYFSFHSAESHVVGSYSARDKAYGTLATTTIEGLNIMDVVTCDRVVARLTTKHPEDASEPSYIPLGSRFENLRIAGHKIDVELATDLFAENHTWGKLTKAYAKDKKFKEELQRLRPGAAKSNEFPGSKGMLSCTLARNLERLPAGLSNNGHGIYVPHFGTVYLGEYFATPHMHRLLMVHVDLGCSIEGCYGSGGAGGNGSWPPVDF